MKKPAAVRDEIHYWLLRHGWVLQRDAANKMNTTRYTVNQLANGRRRITAQMALKLEQATVKDALWWMTLQAENDLYEARRKLK
jgi:addiction module HigA family antidote